MLHVGLTRAEDVLVLQGTTPEEVGEDMDDRAISEAVETLLPPEIPWRPDRGSIPVWTDLSDALSADAADWTETVARSAGGGHGGCVDYGTERLTPDVAREHVLSLGDQVAAGTLDTRLDSTVFGLESLSGPATPQPAIQHSYTSLATFDTCPRKHYLDHVVNAFDDYQPTEGNDFTGVSQRLVGTLFHDTAEPAAEEGSRDRDRWGGTLRTPSQTAP